MRSFKIGSAFGIPIKVDLTFLLILPLLAWVIGTQVGDWVNILNGVFGATLDQTVLTQGSREWYLGLAAAVGLFAGVVLHELGHSLVAIRYGYPIDSITLWILGGIASLSEQPEDWKHELFIAIAGPIVSIVLGALSWVVLTLFPPSLDLVRFVFGYLALMNFALAAFNLLPGFPMDGGRVLRALLARNRPFARATQIAAEVGKLFAILLGIVGLFANLFLILIAFFIYIGASSESQRTTMNAAFEGVTVDDVMTPESDLKTVTKDTTVAELMERMFDERHTGYPVTENGEVVGMVTLEDARNVTEVERDAYTVADVMTNDVYTIPQYDDAMSALEAMQEHGVGRLIVVDANGDTAGLVSRTDLMTAFNIIQNTGRTAQSPSLRA
ncbi:M50 family metallopeptidase [Salarchaeum sp. JOR-1]|uniref:M50 family metallopeptidase n=1 Tax=Salarchaeum sp. JOR-1 TaxID=2599399 RepID=UPI0011987A8B|nr:M50 family metallopeptidase [Salarchaeum sp. JOR-1]QDX40350.1 CBS domain-containing protein [Salarchaeum sp. JOR-1]